MDATIAKLQECELLADLDAASLTTLIKRGQVVDYAQGDLIFKQGSPEHEVFILLEGRVQITVELNRPTEQAPIHTVVPGDLFGEFAIVADIPRSASARALQDCKLFVLERDVFHQLAKEEPWIGYQVMRNLGHILVERITKTTSELRASLMY